jgi:hypothetical protein
LAIHNLFGLTKGGGRDLHFATFQEGFDYIVNHFAQFFQGVKTVDDFLEALKKIGWNSNPKYPDTIRNRIKSVKKHAAECGQQL